MFADCSALEKAPKISNGAKQGSHMFYNCTSLKTAPIIPTSFVNIRSMFENCTSLTGTVEINMNNTNGDDRIFGYTNCFKNVPNPITIIGSSLYKADIAATQTAH